MTEMTITESLQQAIVVGAKSGLAMNELWISEGAARQLAIELAEMQAAPRISPATIFAGMKAGTSKFMDRTIVVADRG